MSSGSLTCLGRLKEQAEFDGGRLVGRRRRTLGVEGERTDAAGRRRTDQLPGARLRRLLRYLAV